MTKRITGRFGDNPNVPAARGAPLPLVTQPMIAVDDPGQTPGGGGSLRAGALVVLGTGMLEREPHRGQEQLLAVLEVVVQQGAGHLGPGGDID